LAFATVNPACGEKVTYKFVNFSFRCQEISTSCRQQFLSSAEILKPLILLRWKIQKNIERRAQVSMWEPSRGKSTARYWARQLLLGISIGFALSLLSQICRPVPLMVEIVISYFVSRFQGFDSGIYSIIISDNRFIDYFNVSGARSGVVASMGMLPPRVFIEAVPNQNSQPRKCPW
jgi:hypothetical protein